MPNTMMGFRLCASWWQTNGAAVYGIQESSSTKPRICLRVLATLRALAVSHAPIRSLDGHQTETMPTSKSTAHCDGDTQTLLRQYWIDCSPSEQRLASTSRQTC